MKVFISSLISDFQAERAAVKEAIETLGHTAIMAEDFPAKASSPQVACLSGVREADLVVLVLGPRYGAVQQSGISATHEEFLEAKGRKTVLTFLQSGATPEPAQDKFIQEASGWEHGLFRAEYSSPDDLRRKVSRALHDHELARAVAPVNPEQLVEKALELMPQVRQNTSSKLTVAVAAGPRQAILRPAEMEAPALAQDLQKEALFGQCPLFESRLGVEHRFEQNALVVFQRGRHGEEASIRLWESGDVLIELPLTRPKQFGLPVVIEEDIAADLDKILAYVAWLFTRMDPTEKLSHVAVAVRLGGGSTLGWRTRTEHAASPNSGTMSGFGQEQQRDAPVMLTPAHRVRQALTMDAHRMVEDFVALLRRRWKG